MSTVAAIHESGYGCENGDSHEGGRLGTIDNPVIHIVVDGESLWRCARCLVRSSKPHECMGCGMDIHDHAVAYCSNCIECEECSSRAIKCEDHAKSAVCTACGIETDTLFCDAVCALDNGHDGGHDCNEYGDDACAMCGESSASYCSADCAMEDGNTLHCSSCGKDRNVTAECPACCSTESEPATGSPQVAKAASTVATVADDGSVSVDGFVIKF